MAVQQNNPWTIISFIKEVISDRPVFLRWLMMNELIRERLDCDEGHEMKIDGRGFKYGLGKFRCRRKHTNGKDRQVSVMKGTWFSKIHISPEKALTLCFMFAADEPFSKAYKEIKYFGQGTSKSTVSSWYRYCRELVSHYMHTQQIEDGMLGGPDVVIEIDETKFGRRKNFVGRIRDGIWIFGIIERDSKRFRLIPCPGNKRDAATLFPIIQQNISPGTTINSDKWKAYARLNSSGFYHFTVNHSENFVDPVTGAHTQTIESSWRPLKLRLISRGIRKRDIGDRLMEYLFRRKMRLENLDPFEEMLRLIRENFPIH